MAALPEGLKRIRDNLLALSPRRLMALGAIWVLTVAMIAVAAFYLGKPEKEILYTGLDAADVSRIGSVLQEVGIAFDVNSANDTVLVSPGQAANARMQLAQRGLPKSEAAGYELFDNMGSLGLTSFMQQVTRVRALEGELARTIQLFDGITSARVHLALRNESSFGKLRQEPTASVVIRAEESDIGRTAAAIQQLVAAAIPGLSPQQVTVLGTNGALLAAPSSDPLAVAPATLIGLERSLSLSLQQKVLDTLSPYLGLDNFRVSIVAKLNTDRKQMSETQFDPESRVERSVRTVKESTESQNADSPPNVSVAQNIPQEAKPPAGGQSSTEKKDSKEELTNYEINSKKVETSSEGYKIDNLSVAVLVNREQLLRTLGDKTEQADIDKAMKEIDQIVRMAAGINEERGDRLQVSAVDFLPLDSGASAEDSFLDSAMRGTLIPTLLKALAFIAVAAILAFWGIKPAVRLIVEGRPSLPAASGEEAVVLLDRSGQQDGHPTPLAAPSRPVADPRIEELARKLAYQPQERLSRIVALDPDRAAQVLKSWLRGQQEGAG